MGDVMEGPEVGWVSRSVKLLEERLDSRKPACVWFGAAEAGGTGRNPAGLSRGLQRRSVCRERQGMQDDGWMMDD